MSSDRTGPGIGAWVLRGLLALAALAAPIVTFRALTDPNTPDANRQQWRREARDGGPDSEVRPSQRPIDRQSIGGHN
jgi:hypothetical protein